MKYLISFALFVSGYSAAAQQMQSDWDAYVTEVGGKPVSIVVDLGLAKKAPMKERTFAITVRLRILKPQANGQPDMQETERLDGLENLMEEQLEKNTGAVYAGRFTQRGLRQFHYFALDTIGYAKALQTAFAGFGEYEWLARASEDKPWSNYFDVLYPGPTDLERIQNRRLVDLLRQKGDELQLPRRIDHYFRFRTKTSRDQFLRQPGMGAFAMEEMPEADADKEHPYALHLYKDDIPDYELVEKLIIPFWEKAKKFQGRYEGWETFLVK